MAAEDLNLENLEDVDLEGLKGLFDGDMDLESDGLPSRKKLMEMLANSNMTEEMKENMKNLLGGGAPQLFGASSGGSYIGLVFILVIFSILRKLSPHMSYWDTYKKQNRSRFGIPCGVE